MNRYPMVFAPRNWSPALNRRAIQLLTPIRKWKMRHQVKLNRFEIRGEAGLQNALKAGKQILIAANHPSHADPFAMYEACARVGTCCHIMAAWHVFAKHSRIMQKCLQWHGCFSVDREANDLTAFRDAVTVLRERKEPLVIFPEGDIYHCNDRLTPFREGAAAIAIAAARRSDRETVIIPAAIRYWYADDPTPHIEQTLEKLEKRILWRPRTEMPIVERIVTIGDAVLGLRELESFGRSYHGPLNERILRLTEFTLSRLEQHYDLRPQDSTPKRVKQIRLAILTRLHDQRTPDERRSELRRHLDDVFMALQLFSYSGDYLDAGTATLERIAETIDKLEEDVLQVKTASVNCRRDVMVQFGQPLPVPMIKSRDVTCDLTHSMESRIRELLIQTKDARSESPGASLAEAARRPA